MPVEGLDEETLELFVYFSMLRALKKSVEQASCKEEIKTIHDQFKSLRRKLISLDSDLELVPDVADGTEEVYLLRQVRVALDQAIALVGILVIPKVTKSKKYARILEDLGIAQSGQPFGRVWAFLTVLGLTNKWAIAASAVCLLEVLVNRKLKASGLNTEGNFEKRVRRLDSEAKKKGIKIPNLLASAFYNVRSKVVHEGKEPTQKELDIILEFLSNFFEETAKL